MSWLNSSLSNIKGQISNFANDVLAQGIPDDADSNDEESSNNLQALIVNQNAEIEALRQQNAELETRMRRNRSGENEAPENDDGWSWDPPDPKEKKIIAELKARIEALENEKQELQLGLEQLDLDCQETTDKLVVIRDDLQNENAKLKSEKADTERKNELLMKLIEENQKRIVLLENENQKCTSDFSALKLEYNVCKNKVDELSEIKKYYKDNKLQEDVVIPEDYHKLELILQEYENKVCTYEEEIASLKIINAELSQKSEKDKLHKKYVEILKESITKCTEHPFPATDSSTSQLSEYTNIVESILKTILDYKWKCETLDKEVLNLTEEKTKILTEKNHEIEKLLRNSEDLSREIIKKGQDLKHYEEECAEILKNNEMLIAKLEEVKNSSGNLETISESNEDNVLQLETQLENANKRVEELELIIADMENGKQESSTETQTELAYIKTQLNLTGTELDDTKKQYQTLLNRFQDLEGVNSNLRHNFDECYHEKEDLNTTVDQIKSEYENTEYKYAEQNINMETLKEEIETHMEKIDILTKQNKKLVDLTMDLEGKNELLQKEIDDLKQELTVELEGREQKQVLLQNLEEKLQISKMGETSLKLQFDKLFTSKEALQAESDAAKTHYEVKISSQENENLKLQEEIATLKNATDIQAVIADKNEILDQTRALISEKEDLLNENRTLIEELSEKSALIASLTSDKLELQNRHEVILAERLKLQSDFENFKSSVAENNQPIDEIANLQSQIAELSASRTQLIQLIQDKHQENVNYHSEIQRLQTIGAESAQKNEKLTDQNGFLQEKCAVLTENLLHEQQKFASERSGALEREAVLQKKLDSLTQHLLEMEEMYTKEVQQAENKCEEMQQKMHEIEQREKNSNNRYTSVNIRANQQVETLQTQLQLVTNQRDELRKKISESEDLVGKQNAALTNLQIVLQQFQRDKENDVHNEIERVRRQITIEKDIQGQLKTEIQDLKSQLEESKEALKAAVRLSDQVEASKRQVNTMKEEVSKLNQELSKSQEKCSKLANQTDGKVDKLLIKNLVIGMISANNNLTKDQNQILKIISTVLDFNQQDIEKVQLNKAQQHSWFGGLLHPQTIAGQTMTQETLSQAFVKFLEAESKPRELPNLLETAAVEVKGDDESKGSVRHSPIILNEVVLPTFADFGQNRNSSSILKDVLKDNTNR